VWAHKAVALLAALSFTAVCLVPAQHVKLFQRQPRYITLLGGEAGGLVDSFTTIRK
jgi:hypothetical protein